MLAFKGKQLHPEKHQYSMYRERHLVAKQVLTIYCRHSSPILPCNTNSKMILHWFSIIPAHYKAITILSRGICVDH